MNTLIKMATLEAIEILEVFKNEIEVAWLVTHVWRKGNHQSVHVQQKRPNPIIYVFIIYKIYIPNSSGKE